jgi:hypothetical protein
MKSIVKTAGSFDKVLASCKTIGGRYQPVEPSLSITAMSELFERSQQSSQAVIVTRSAYRLAMIDRRELFAGIPSLAVRVVRILSTCEPSKETLQAAINLKNILTSGSKKVNVDVKASEGNAPAVRGANRKHFYMQAETFANLVKIVEDTGSYNANEPELTIAALKAKVAELQSSTHAVNIAAIAFDHARRERLNLFYGAKGVTATIQGVKNYVRGAFGL